MEKGNLRDKIKNNPMGFERGITASYWWLLDQSPPKAIIETNLSDRYHDISLILEVDLTKQIISDHQIEERRTPFHTCPGAVPNYSFLTDLKFNRPTLERKIKEHLPQSQSGCIRIDQLIYFSVDNFISALGYELKSRQIPDRWNEERHVEGAEPFEKRSKAVHQWWLRDKIMKNSCYTMKTEFESPIEKEYLSGEPTITNLILGMMKDRR